MIQKSFNNSSKYLDKERLTKALKLSCTCLVFLPVFLIGCASQQTARQVTTTDDEQTAPNTIARIPERTSPQNPRYFSIADIAMLADTSKTAPILITTGEIRREYEEIAIIRTSERLSATLAELNERLRDEARKLGAAAVIRVQYGYGYSGRLGYPFAIGTAVKYKP